MKTPASNGGEFEIPISNRWDFEKLPRFYPLLIGISSLFWMSPLLVAKDFLYCYAKLFSILSSITCCYRCQNPLVQDINISSIQTKPFTLISHCRWKKSALQIRILILNKIKILICKADFLLINIKAQNIYVFCLLLS